MQRRDLVWADCDDVFRSLHAHGLLPVVVGGQAVNLWVDYYAALSQLVPLASKDVDVVGDQNLARDCANVLGGHCTPINRIETASSLNAVIRLGESDDALRIDFQGTSEPNTAAEVESNAVRLPTTWGQVRVMHPLHCVKSRVYNVLEIWSNGQKKYDNPHGVAQMNASIEILRCFIRERSEISGADEKIRAVYELLFEFRLGRLGRCLKAQKGIDLFECIDPTLSCLSKKFVDRRYPQMRALMERAGV